MAEERASDQNLESLPPLKTKTISSRVRTVIFILEVSLVAGLLIWWISSDSAKVSRNLWVLFFYCFPAEFIVASVPHEPVLLYFGKFTSPLTVALVSIAGTALTEIINYTVFKYVADLKLFQKMLQSKFVQKSVSLFNKAPFAALLFAGFTPLPFYPFRFLVVIAHYPLTKYILAVALSRTPRFYLYALLGKVVKIPDYLLVVLLVFLILVANIPILRNVFKKRRKDREDN